MKKLFHPLIVAVGIGTSFVPLLVLAQAKISLNIPGTTPNSTSTPGAYIANFYQFALMIGGVLAFGVIVYGGVRYMASAGNPSGQSDAKEWIEGALLGLLLLVGAYFVLNVINPKLITLTLPTLNQASVVAPASGTGSTGTGSASGPSSSGASTNCSGLAAGGSGGGNSVSSGVFAAATSYCGVSTANGPGNGTVSCAWAVNNVLAAAGDPPLDTDSVQAMENALTSGAGTLVSPAQAQPGDIVIQAQDGHVGICMNVGCTEVLSNSSSNASFTWVSNTSFSPSYSGGPGRIYQLNS